MSCGVLTGCATGTYHPPIGDLATQQNERLVKKSFDETWSALVEHTSQTFFGIDKFEKASGLLTLSFGAANLERFIDCGRIDVQTPGKPTDGSHNYVEYLSKFGGGRLDGKMNLLVKSVTPNETLVRVSAKYIFSTPANQDTFANVWSFDSNSQATIAVGNATKGTVPTRTCRPTLVAEKTILDAIAK